MTTIYYILLTLFVVLSLFLILLVLIQKGRGGGLSAAFGGVGGNTAFGAKTGDVLTWATSVIFGVFIVLGISLNLLANRIHEQNTNLTAGVEQPATQPSSAETESPDAGKGLTPTEEAVRDSVPAATQPSTQPTTQPK
jgi:preprotein translocase subunit SecG